MQIDPFSKHSYGYGTVKGDVTPMERRDDLLDGLGMRFKGRGPSARGYRHIAKSFKHRPIARKLIRISPIERIGYGSEMGAIPIIGSIFGGSKGRKALAAMKHQENLDILEQAAVRNIEILYNDYPEYGEDFEKAINRWNLYYPNSTNAEFYRMLLGELKKLKLTKKISPIVVEQPVIERPVVPIIDRPVTRQIAVPTNYRPSPSTFIPEEVFIGNYAGLHGYYDGDYDGQLNGFFKKLVRKIVKPFKKIAAKIDPIRRKVVKQKEKRTAASYDLAQANAMLSGILTPEARQQWTSRKLDAEARLGMASKKLSKARKFEKIAAVVAATVVTGGAAAGLLGPGAAGFVGSVGHGVLAAAKGVGSLIAKGASLIKSGAVGAGKLLAGKAITGVLQKQPGIPSEVAETVGIEAGEVMAQTGEPISDWRLADITNAAMTAYQARNGNMDDAAALLQAREESGGGAYQFSDAASEQLEEQDKAAETNKFLIPALIGGGVLLTMFMMKGK